MDILVDKDGFKRDIRRFGRMVGGTDTRACRCFKLKVKYLNIYFISKILSKKQKEKWKKRKRSLKFRDIRIGVVCLNFISVPEYIYGVVHSHIHIT